MCIHDGFSPQNLHDLRIEGGAEKGERRDLSGEDSETESGLADGFAEQAERREGDDAAPIRHCERPARGRATKAEHTDTFDAGLPCALDDEPRQFAVPGEYEEIFRNRLMDRRWGRSGADGRFGGAFGRWSMVHRSNYFRTI